MTQVRARPRGPMAHARQPTYIAAVIGTVDDVSLRGGLHFFLREQLGGRRVRVDAPADRLDEVAPLLGRRIEASGPAVLDADRRPARLTLERLFVFPREEELPSLEDELAELRKIDITGGLSSEEFVRRLRDD